MEKYNVKIYARAYRELDEIYAYIAGNLAAPEAVTRRINVLAYCILTAN